jgi:hypothetical protein
MKRNAFILLTFACLLFGCGQHANKDGAEQAIPISKLNVENLLDSLDLNMDISQLPLSDLRILENVFLAQKGYPFEDSYIRSVYQATTWYDSLMWLFDGTEENFNFPDEYNENASYRDTYYGSIKSEVLKLTDEQQAFINRIKTREAEIQATNFTPEVDGRVNMMNVVNPNLIKDINPVMWNKLGQNGFTIIPARHQQLFHVYEQNDYHEFPAFVTTDLYLQLYHLYFDCMLREVEEQQLDTMVEMLCLEGYNAMYLQSQTDQPQIAEGARWLCDYFAVALNLNGKHHMGFANKSAPVEIEKIMDSENDFSDFLGYTDAMFAYSLFKPRGHYTRNARLEHYFRTMMWLQTVPFRTDDSAQLGRAVLLAQWLNNNDKARRLYNYITVPLTYLMGQPDNISILQVAEIAKETGVLESKDISDTNKMQALRQQVEAVAKQQTRIKAKFSYSGEYKINLMPQRYQPDAEVLQEMVDYESKTTKRDVPKGLDFMAALGCSAAEKILLDELNEPDRWDKYKPTLERMKKRMNKIDWTENSAVQWMQTVKTVTETPQNAPYFMRTDEWDRKSLNTALASWAELKHDAILYAKQPFGAECGGGGPPDPVVKGYVEPNVNFWKKAIALLDQTKEVLNKYALMTEKIENIHSQVKEQAEFLLRLSEKELKGEMPNDIECDQLEYIGATFENISIALLRDNDHQLWSWDDIQGPDKKVALVADVYTANADNNPNKSILYEAVGDADEIYVVVEIGGYLHLMRGAVFSYREFQRPVNDQRLNDEEWQQYLEQHPRSGVPSWMEPIIAPLEDTPVDNEGVFYSTGC